MIARRNILDGREDDPSLVLHDGCFPETFKDLEDWRWRFVHLDADLYAPTYAGLEAFFPRLVPGGLVLMHDYHSFYRGVEEAARAYFGPLGIIPVPLCDKAGSAVVFKPVRG